MTHEALVDLDPTLQPQIPLSSHSFLCPCQIPYRFPIGTDCFRHLCLTLASHPASTHKHSKYLQIAQWTVTHLQNLDQKSPFLYKFPWYCLDYKYIFVSMFSSPISLLDFKLFISRRFLIHLTIPRISCGSWKIGKYVK